MGPCSGHPAGEALATAMPVPAGDRQACLGPLLQRQTLCLPSRTGSSVSRVPWGRGQSAHRTQCQRRRRTRPKTLTAGGGDRILASVWSHSAGPARLNGALQSQHRQQVFQTEPETTCRRHPLPRAHHTPASCSAGGRFRVWAASPPGTAFGPRTPALSTAGPAAKDAPDGTFRVQRIGDLGSRPRAPLCARHASLRRALLCRSPLWPSQQPSGPRRPVPRGGN